MATILSISVWNSLDVTAGVLKLTYAGPICYDCTRISYSHDCVHVRQCDDGEICETRLLLSDSGQQYVDTGCQLKAICLSKRDVSVVTYGEMDDQTGDISVCNECCHGDFCNTHGCGMQPLPELSARGPVCFSCNQQQSPDSCEMVTMCRHDEVCSLLRYISSTNDILYTSSCKSESFCTALQGVVQPAIVGRRSATGLCMGCCNTDHCNRNCSVVTNIHPSQPETTSSTTQVTILVPTHATTPSTTYVAMHSKEYTTTPSTTYVATHSRAHTTTQSTTTLAQEILNKIRCESMGYIFLSAFDVCYRVYSNTLLSWQKSREYCQRYGGDLIVFHSTAEERVFETIAKGLSPTYLIHIQYWVGASDIQSESTWIWLDGTPVDQKYFHPTEPNNAFIEEDCGAMMWYWTDNRVILNDNACYNQYNFICEIK